MATKRDIECIHIYKFYCIDFSKILQLENALCFIKALTYGEGISICGHFIIFFYWLILNDSLYVALH